jgi:hypothetical protein
MQGAFDGVTVLDIRPRGWSDNGRVIIDIHGGAFLRAQLK